MEYYFQANNVPEEEHVRACIVQFHPDHFTEIQEHRYLPYSDFKTVVTELFRAPDLTHTKLQELNQVKQQNEETQEDFMNRIRNLTEKALRQLPDHEKQILSVNSFCQ